MFRPSGEVGHMPRGTVGARGALPPRCSSVVPVKREEVLSRVLLVGPVVMRSSANMVHLGLIW